jgi:hypothetical protein
MVIKDPNSACIHITIFPHVRTCASNMPEATWHWPLLTRVSSPARCSASRTEQIAASERGEESPATRTQKLQCKCRFGLKRITKGVLNPHNSLAARRVEAQWGSWSGLFPQCQLVAVYGFMLFRTPTVNFRFLSYGTEKRNSQLSQERTVREIRSQVIHFAFENCTA